MPTYYRIDNIEIPARQRRAGVKEAEISSLATSIAENGLINPVCVLRTNQAQGRLIAGWRRLNAMSLLHASGEPFVFESQPVPKGMVPVSPISEADLPALLQLEFAENKERLNLPWQDELAAIAAIDEARRASAPLSTQKELAGELAARTGIAAASYERNISRALAVQKALDKRPDLAKARSAEEAYKLLTRERHESFEAELAKRKIRSADLSSPPWTMTHGDCRELLPQLSKETFDLVLVDPPYGIGIDDMKYAPTQLHRYDDDLASSLALCKFILREGWRLTKTKANLFMFCDWELYPALRTFAAQQGWDPWFRPIIWNKSLKEGATPWGSQGFMNTYECILWATKGRLCIKGPLPDVLYSQKVGVVNRDHAAEKPVEFLMQLINLSTEVGDSILDPCAGSGSVLDAALRTKRSVVGIEIDEIYYNRAMTRLGRLAEAIQSNKKLVEA